LGGGGILDCHWGEDGYTGVVGAGRSMKDILDFLISEVHVLVLANDKNQIKDGRNSLRGK